MHMGALSTSGDFDDCSCQRVKNDARFRALNTHTQLRYTRATVLPTNFAAVLPSDSFGPPESAVLFPSRSPVGYSTHNPRALCVISKTQHQPRAIATTNPRNTVSPNASSRKKERAPSGGSLCADPRQVLASGSERAPESELGVGERGCRPARVAVAETWR